MKKVKVSFPYPNWPLTQQLPLKETTWLGCEFFINPDGDDRKEYDVHFVFNYPLKEEDITVTKFTVLITGEPESVERYSPKYVEQFDAVVTSQPGIDHPHKISTQQGLPWFIDKSYDELVAIMPMEKIKTISIISSTKSITAGHRERLKFAMKVKAMFKDKVDIYGRGLATFTSKWDTLSPYRYSIVIENSIYNDYLSEKICDTYLAYTMPIYYGAPNISKYFDEGSYVGIDIKDSRKSFLEIERLIESNEYYHNHLALIEKQRDKVLNEYNLFALMARLAILPKNDLSYRVKSIKKILPINRSEQNILKRLWGKVKI